MRENFARLLCIFPFEEKFFQDRQVPTTYIGHPLARLIRPTLSRAELCDKLEISSGQRIVVLLPGSRHGEAARHLPTLVEAVKKIQIKQKPVFVLALPPGFGRPAEISWEPIRAASIQVLEGHTWDVLAAMARDAGVSVPTLRVDGGMVVNDALMQFQCDILNVPVVRARVIETTALGAAYAAGLAVGYWQDLEDLRGNWQVERKFEPAMAADERSRLTSGWRKAVERSFGWA